jgi:hypothetical protein
MAVPRNRADRASMTPERWAQVNNVLHWAIQLAPERRAAFLDGACADDDSLRHEVESVLAADDQACFSFLQVPPAVRLAKGFRLGDYEIRSFLGTGDRAPSRRLHSVGGREAQLGSGGGCAASRRAVAKARQPCLGCSVSRDQSDRRPDGTISGILYAKITLPWDSKYP